MSEPKVGHKWLDRISTVSSFALAVAIIVAASTGNHVVASSVKPACSDPECVTPVLDCQTCQRLYCSDPAYPNKQEVTEPIDKGGTHSLGKCTINAGTYCASTDPNSKTPCNPWSIAIAGTKCNSDEFYAVTFTTCCTRNSSKL